MYKHTINYAKGHEIIFKPRKQPDSESDNQLKFLKKIVKNKTQQLLNKYRNSTVVE